MTARIMIVDDVPVNTRLLEAKLSAEYYQVTSARNGFEALEIARDWQPDLILLDVMMPGMDGYECCRLLKDDAATQHIPVVMVTALGESSERLRGLEAGADDFLTKPVEYDTLMARVHSLVRLKRLLDEWRARGETAHALGLGVERVLNPSVVGAHVLVVDDWDLGAQSIENALSRDGIIPSRARSERDALTMTASVAFDLIVVSLSLVDEDPLKLVASMRAADSTHEVPLLLVADPEERDRILRGFALGASDWLMLPVDDNELRARARNQIRRKFYQDRLRSDMGTALELALTDPLTGLYNRRYLRRHLSGLMDGNQGRELAVLMLDVDHFKLVNDQHGHATGDRALQLIAETLRENTRVFDSLSRYGGEEFVVVMPGSGPVDASAAAERLRAAVEVAVFDTQTGTREPLTVSVGVACTHGQPVSPDVLLQAADLALYEAKREGRNRVVMAAGDAVDWPSPTTTRPSDGLPAIEPTPRGETLRVAAPLGAESRKAGPVGTRANTTPDAA
jgi:two-component system cell cycle response regulator